MGYWNITLPDREGWNELGFGVQGHEDVLVVYVKPLRGKNKFLLLLNERPDLIHLHEFAGKPAHSRFEKLLASVAYSIHQAEDSVTVDTSHSLNAADAGAFYKGRDY